MPDPRHPHPPTPGAPDHQPLVDAFTDVPQTEAERPADVDPDDMFAPGGE